MRQAGKIQQEKAERRGIQVERPLDDLQWLCTSCQFILGFVNREKTEVRMKAKDFFLTVEGGKVTHPCRRCGQLNMLTDKEYLMWQSERKSFDEFLANRDLFQGFLGKKKDFDKFLASEKKEKSEKKK